MKYTTAFDWRTDDDSATWAEEMMRVQRWLHVKHGYDLTHHGIQKKARRNSPYLERLAAGELALDPRDALDATACTLDWVRHAKQSHKEYRQTHNAMVHKYFMEMDCIRRPRCSLGLSIMGILLAGGTLNCENLDFKLPADPAVGLAWARDHTTLR